MHGSLALRAGVLYVGRCAKTAWVATFDLDGHPLEGGFEFRDESVGRSTVSGLAVDDDHRIWVADSAAGRVRAFTLFGQSVAEVGDDLLDETCGLPPLDDDARGRLGQPVDIEVAGCDDAQQIAVASGGTRRHALQILHPYTRGVRSLRPDAGPRGTFHDLRGLAWRDERLYACEAGAGAVRVYERGALHWSLHLPVAGNARFEPTAVAPLSDGRLLIACGDEDSSALLLCDADGHLRRILAESGAGIGSVEAPLDVVVDEHCEGGPRAVVIDRAGLRVQVFTLEGRCYGAFPQLTGS